ncbi:MAG: hypothetical protein IKB95_08575, partial [Bacteroidales bacterium]|nr:hypothetical protein [Bacteroidales bacterium]
MEIDIPNTVIEDDLLIPVFIKSPNFIVKDSETLSLIICLQSARLHHKYSNLLRKSQKFERFCKVFRFNPAAQAFAPSHLGIACKPALHSVWRRFRFL